jgi:type II secretory pathway component PulL
MREVAGSTPGLDLYIYLNSTKVLVCEGQLTCRSTKPPIEGTLGSKAVAFLQPTAKIVWGEVCKAGQEHFNTCIYFVV